jgi:hypothetical protein
MWTEDSRVHVRWAALLLIGLVTACTSSSASSSTVTAAAPANLEAKTQADHVTLSWDAPTSGAPDHYIVFRDDQQLGTVTGSATTFTDSDVAPATRYSYKVRAVVDDAHTADSDDASVRTPTPPVSAARLTGLLPVRYTVTSSTLSNTHPGSLSRYFWKLTPGCHEGRCGGKWHVGFKSGGGADGTFSPAAGGIYLGQMKNQGLGTCGSLDDHLDSSSFRIRVLKAGVRNNQWVVLAFSGTIRQYYPAENGCISSSYQATVDGSYVGGAR